MIEVGRAQRTIFVARYLRDRDLQREISEGLNVVESWNRANSVIFYGKGGDLVGADREHAGVSMLALHLLLAAFMHLNTALVEAVLAEPGWAARMTEADRCALTPLFWTHVNCYGKFDLDVF